MFIKIIKYVIALIVCAFGYTTSAQVVQVNPRSDWKYVRSQELTLQENSLYQFEVPADAAYDYLLNLTIKEANVETFISVTDLQGKPISKHSASQKLEQLEFNVPASGTYKISILYKGSEDDDGTTPITVNLIRRPTTN